MMELKILKEYLTAFKFKKDTVDDKKINQKGTHSVAC